MDSWDRGRCAQHCTADGIIAGVLVSARQFPDSSVSVMLARIRHAGGWVMWEVRPAPLVGGGHEHRDFEFRRNDKPGLRPGFTVMLRWNNRVPDDEQVRQRVEYLFRCFREIAAQDGLPIRR
jgi:hypothetical protein